MRQPSKKVRHPLCPPPGSASSASDSPAADGARHCGGRGDTQHHLRQVLSCLLCLLLIAGATACSDPHAASDRGDSSKPGESAPLEGQGSGNPGDPAGSEDPAGLDASDDPSSAVEPGGTGAPGTDTPGDAPGEEPGGGETGGANADPAQGGSPAGGSASGQGTEAPAAPGGANAQRPAPPASTDVRTTDDGNLFVLVNKTYAVSADYMPTDMVAVDGSLSTNQGLTVKREAYDAYLAMLQDARAEGLDFYICSAYRSYDTQKSLYDNSLAVNGQAYTETMFAYPGKSEHHTGYAIDITSASMGWGLQQNFADYPDGAWITAHCSEYGFIIRYPEGKEDITGYVYEPWHVRYIGLEAAQEITRLGITLEEYLGVA